MLYQSYNTLRTENQQLIATTRQSEIQIQDLKKSCNGIVLERETLLANIHHLNVTNQVLGQRNERLELIQSQGLGKLSDLVIRGQSELKIHIEDIAKKLSNPDNV